MQKSRPRYVLGTGLSHDGSACLLKDGEILVGIEKERLTRKKHDGLNDSIAIQYCLDAAGIKLSEVELIVQNANFGMFEYGDDWFAGPRLLDGSVPVVTISHHLAHAYSAFGASSFDEAAVLVLDGCGSGFDECVDLDGAMIPERPQGEMCSLWFEKDSLYHASETTLQPLYKDFSPMGVNFKRYPMHPPTTRHSIGGLYAAVSTYVFGGIDDSGKLMGLAPYGRSGRYEFEAFELRDGRAFVRYDWMKSFTRPCRSEGEFKQRFQEFADIAFWAQKEVERAILYICASRFSMCRTSNLCYAGGVALNAVANRRIMRETPFEHIYIQPAAGDNGLSVGCAYYGWFQVLKGERIRPSRSTYFGRTYSKNEIEAAIERHRDGVHASECVDPVREATEALCAGKVVAWFRGGSEFGPRALGNRSILADARVAGIREYINKFVKFREDFRPFAPSVLAEQATSFFDYPCESPHMLLVVSVRPEWKDLIPGVVHCDLSARLQTVTRLENPEFYRLLSEFRARTGIGLLLNTSFNRRRMPIVESPEDAIRFFMASGIHALILEEFVIRKRRDGMEHAPNDSEQAADRQELLCDPIGTAEPERVELKTEA